METRVKKYRQQLSPERSKVWKEKPPKYYKNRKVPVVYYLCRNRQLEHPHFMEVPISSPDGLFLRDVIDKLDALRGRGMASLYSWSCKRSYKNGYVWHDLSEDDLIQPAHGNEYVLKGSELFCESNSDHFSPISNVKLQRLKRLPEPVSCRSHDEASSSSSMNEREGRNSHEDEVSPSQHTGSSDVSPESRDGNSDSQSLSLTEYKIYKTDGSADASTQTEEYTSRSSTQKTCTKGVSTEDSSLGSECDEICETQAPQVKDNSEICPDVVSPPLSNSSPLSSRGKTETLESLIRADASRMNSFRIVEDEGIHMQTSTRLKASNLLLQLISCGSISVKNHSLDLIPSYKARFSHSKFPSPLFSTSVMLGELDCIGGNLKATSLRMEDREYFSGSLVESKMAKEEDGHNVLKRSSSFNSERTNKESKSQDIEEPSSGTSKCNSRSINDSGILPIPSNGNSKSITRPTSEKKYSMRLNSFREEKACFRSSCYNPIQTIFQHIITL
ncbi:protein SOSEKI 3-like isoform X2 [Trifolium pratense]|uniref:protein SOSEKI 3-like isoform X2 n=1 Tax=Trifolium pratense TaxID=57577 RepID=UPI001E69722F|nr:protein SOSEKI 3-like isoform X2 [Trifolium pratense]